MMSTLGDFRATTSKLQNQTESERIQAITAKKEYECKSFEVSKYHHRLFDEQLSITSSRYRKSLCVSNNASTKTVSFLTPVIWS